MAVVWMRDDENPKRDKGKKQRRETNRKLRKSTKYVKFDRS